VELDGIPRPASSAEMRDVLRPGAEYQLVHRRTADEIQNELHSLVRNYNAFSWCLACLIWKLRSPYGS
jgi:hypothetical protein